MPEQNATKRYGMEWKGTERGKPFKFNCRHGNPRRGRAAAVGARNKNLYLLLLRLQFSPRSRAVQSRERRDFSNSCINCDYKTTMERLLDLFDRADPFSTWWPTIAAVVVGLVITVR